MTNWYASVITQKPENATKLMKNITKHQDMNRRSRGGGRGAVAPPVEQAIFLKEQ